MTTGVSNAASFFGKPVKITADSTTLRVPANKNHVHLLNTTGSTQNVDYLSTPNNPAGRTIRFMGTSDTGTVTFRDNQAGTNLSLNGTSVVLSNGEYLMLSYDETNDQWNQLAAAGSEVSETELEFLNGVTAGTATASKALVLGSSKEIATITTATITNLNSTTADAATVTNANLTLESLNPMTVKLNDTDALQLDNAAISSFAGAADTAGNDVYVETEDGGAGTGAAVGGGLLSVKTGDGGSAASGDNAGANGGALTLTSGAGSAIGTQSGGTANGGSGGAITIVTGDGAGGGDSSGTDGSGGVLTLQTGAKGTGGNSAGIDGTIDLSLGGVVSAKIANAAITDYAGAADTAGASLFIEGQNGGSASGAAVAGGSMTFTAGSAGASGGGTGDAGADGGDLSLTAGAASDVGTQASGTANGGAGGSITLTAGAGGDGGDSSGTDGDGGDVVLTPGAAGSGGNTAGRSGVVSVPDGKIAYIGAITMPGTTEGTNWLGIDVGTAPTGTIATSIAVYTSDGDNLSFLHADGTTDDLGT